MREIGDVLGQGRDEPPGAAAVELRYLTATHVRLMQRLGLLVLAVLVAEYNAADVTFAQQTIPHHSQAITISQLAPIRAASPEVKEPATKIEQAQGPKLKQMNAMLATWGGGAPAPPAGNAAMAGTSTLGMSMPGKVGEGQMQQLGASSGGTFDRGFLQMMIEHNNSGANQTVQTELAQGQNPQAKKPAQAIIADQQSEILQTQVLLGRV